MITMEPPSLICVRLMGCNVVNVSELQSANGLLSKMFQRVAYGKGITPKNERRIIKIYQTSPFPTEQKSQFTPTESLIFTSEIFEDLSAAENGVNSAICAEVRCPAGYDCTLRVDLHYSSNICSKDTVLASGIFTWRNLLSHSSSSSSFCCHLESNYTLGAKAYIDVVAALPPVGTQSGICPFVPPASKGRKTLLDGRPVNPLRTRYVFYANEDFSRPRLVAEEITWEPRCTMTVPLLVLESFLASLTRSIDAWTLRRSLEKIRQGLFDKTEDAFRCGWQKVTVTVHGAHLSSSRVLGERDSNTSTSNSISTSTSTSTSTTGPISFNSNTYAHANAATNSSSSFSVDARQNVNVASLGRKMLNTTTCIPLDPGASPYANNIASGGLVFRRASSYSGSSSSGAGGVGASTSADTSSNSSASKGALSDVGIAYGASELMDEEEPGVTSANTIANSASPSKSVTINTTRRQSTNSSLSLLGRKFISSTSQLASGTVTLHSPDSSLPSTFVQIYIDDDRCLFSSHLGRTNTEYHTMEPVYGANINAASVVGAQEEHVSGYGGITIDGSDTANGGSSASPRFPSNTATPGNKKERSTGLSAVEGGGLGKTKVPVPAAVLASAGVSMILKPKIYQFSRLDSMHGAAEGEGTGSGSGSFGGSISGVSGGGGGSSGGASQSISGNSSIGSRSSSGLGTHISVQGVECRFEKFVPGGDNGRHTRVRFDVYLDLSAGGGIVGAVGALGSGLAGRGVSGRGPGGLGKGIVLIGTCFLPCIPDHTKDIWLPVTPSPEWLSSPFNTSGVDDVMVHVTIGVQGSTSGNSNNAPIASDKADQATVPASPSSTADGTADASGGTKPKPKPFVVVGGKRVGAPVNMNVVARRERLVSNASPHATPASSPTTSPDKGSNSSNNSAASSSVTPVSDIVAGCYEWLWAVGYKGTDPLALDGNADIAEMNILSHAISDAASNNLLVGGGSPKSTRKASVSLNTNMNANTSSVLPPEVQRVDVPLPLAWLDDYIHELMRTKNEISQLISGLKMWAKDGHTFRPSAQKKDPSVQPLPINLHAQLFCVAQHVQYSEGGSSASDVASTSSTAPVKPPRPTSAAAAAATAVSASTSAAAAAAAGPSEPPPTAPTKSKPSSGKSRSKVVVCDCLTSGAVTPHALGYARGGLEQLDSSLQAARLRLEDLKLAFAESAGIKWDLGAAACLGATSTSGVFPPDGPQAAFLREIAQVSTSYELDCIPAAVRRLLSISQALTIITSGVLLKLSLLIEGHIPVGTAEQWFKEGLLFVFEGLLSVVGKERGMLEDTSAALAAVSAYVFAIRAYDADDLELGIHSPGSSPQSASEGKASPSAASTGIPGTTAGEGARLSLEGRKVVVSLPRAVYDRLQSMLTNTDAQLELRVLPVLFTQGVDIQQTVVLASGRGTSTMHNVSSTTGLTQAPGVDDEEEERPPGALTGSDLQARINLRGLLALDDYCRRIMPVDGEGSGMIKNSAVATEEKKFAASAAAPTSRNGNESTASSSTSSTEARAVHPFLRELDACVRLDDRFAKNMDLLQAVERSCTTLGGMRVTFCKSGKDRTGMVVTLEQARQLGDRFLQASPSPSAALNPSANTYAGRVLRDASSMRARGTRLDICEKNIGKRVYSINKLQTQFLPVSLRPPPHLLEDLFKTDLS